jgi:hypothetical protein
MFEKDSNFMKIRPVGAEVFHADRQADRHDEANSRFPQFCEGAWKRLEIYLTNQQHCTERYQWSIRHLK